MNTLDLPSSTWQTTERKSTGLSCRCLTSYSGRAERPLLALQDCWEATTWWHELVTLPLDCFTLMIDAP